MNISDMANVLYDKSGRCYVISSKLEGMDRCMSFMREVVHGKKMCMETKFSSTNKVLRKPTSLGLHLIYLQQYANLFARNYEFHPAISFFFEAYRAHEIRCYDYSQLNDRSVTGVPVFEVFDDFVGAMRSQVKALELKKKILDWESKGKKRMVRIRKLVTKLLDQHTTLRAIRLDLTYESASFEADEIPQVLLQLDSEKIEDMNQYWLGSDISNPILPADRVSFSAIQHDRKRLCANIKGKPKLFEQLRGYVWRINWSPNAGFYMQLALLLTCNEVAQHDDLAESIGEYWVKNITQGRGSYRNLNAIVGTKLANHGVGVFDCRNVEDRRALMVKVLHPLCLDLKCVEVKPYRGCNLFGTGFVHTSRSNSMTKQWIKCPAVRKPPGPRRY